MLLVKKLDARAILPTVAHPGEDIGYDVYALDDQELQPFAVNKIKTGIAVADFHGHKGYLIRDRSSMALQGTFVVGGVIDAGYRGEVVVLIRTGGNTIIDIKAGQKIAQLIPVEVFTEQIKEVQGFAETSREAAGFGSSGK